MAAAENNLPHATKLAIIPLILICMIQVGTTGDNSVVFNATSALMESFQVTIPFIQIANAMFPLTASALMIICGFIGLILGWRCILLFGLGILVLGEITAMLSPNMFIFTYVARILAGVGASLAISGSLGLVPRLYQGHHQAIAFAAIASANGLALAFGPILGGAIITTYGWRFAFLALAIFFGIIFLCSFGFQSIPKPFHKPKFDYVGAILLILSIFISFSGLLSINSWGFIQATHAPFTLFGFSPSLFIILIGLLLFWLFLLWQRRIALSSREMLLPEVFLKNKQARSGLYFIMLSFGILGSISFLIITFLQIADNKNALETGVVVSSYAVGLAFSALMVPLLFKTLSPRLLCRIGILLTTAACLVMSYGLDTRRISILLIIGLCLCGIGSGIILSQASIIITRTVSNENAEQSGGLQGTMRNLGFAAGIALSGIVLISSLTMIAKAEVKTMTSLPALEKHKIETLTNIKFLSNQALSQKLEIQHMSLNQLRNMLHANTLARVSAERTSLYLLSILFLLFLFPTRHLSKRSLMLDD